MTCSGTMEHLVVEGTEFEYDPPSWGEFSSLVSKVSSGPPRRTTLRLNAFDTKWFTRLASLDKMVAEQIIRSEEASSA
jgi:hypothetical protein